MERIIIASIEVDDDRAIEEDRGTIDYFENEMGWVGESGILVQNCMIADDDDEDDFARYRNYVALWALEMPDEGTSPLSYEEWLKS